MSIRYWCSLSIFMVICGCAHTVSDRGSDVQVAVIEEDGLPEGFGGGGIGAMLESTDGTMTVTRLEKMLFSDGSFEYEVHGTFAPTEGAVDDSKKSEDVLVFSRETMKPESFLKQHGIAVGAKVQCVRKVFESTMLHAGGVEHTGRTCHYIYYRWDAAR